MQQWPCIGTQKSHGASLAKRRTFAVISCTSVLTLIFVISRLFETFNERCSSHLGNSEQISLPRSPGFFESLKGKGFPKRLPLSVGFKEADVTWVLKLGFESNIIRGSQFKEPIWGIKEERNRALEERWRSGWLQVVKTGNSTRVRGICFVFLSQIHRWYCLLF
ncbi:hypothetical protein BDW69DRAFT_177122 [Aspergillus filifer]